VPARWAAALAAAKDAGALPGALLSPGVTPPRSAQQSARAPTPTPSPSASKKKRKRAPAPKRAKRASADPDADDPGPDPLLAVPGEVVLARWDGSATHWPARITGYARGRYALAFCDGSAKAQPRAAFVCEADDGFARVPLGRLASDEPAPAPGAEDVSASPFATRGAGDDDGGSDIPAPVLPPPAPFGELPMRAQLGYVLPVLRALVRGALPASALHAAFFAGGRARAQVLARQHLRGDLQPADCAAMERGLRAWLLGRRAPRACADDEGEGGSWLDAPAPPDDADPALPTGPEYGALSALDKIHVRLAPPRLPRESALTRAPRSTSRACSCPRRRSSCCCGTGASAPRPRCRATRRRRACARAARRSARRRTGCAASCAGARRCCRRGRSGARARRMRGGAGGDAVAEVGAEKSTSKGYRPAYASSGFRCSPQEPV
jgi:hypothetical protein